MTPQLDIRQPGSFADTLQGDPEAWALRINAAWRRSLESVIETGRLLIDAKARLKHGQWEIMVGSLDFSPDTAQRLMAIARDERLTNPAHARFLPRSYTTLAELTKLSDGEFGRGIAENIIRPDMERKDVEIIRPVPQRGSPDAGSDGRADEAVARDVDVASGSQKGAAAPAKDENHESVDEAGMGSERPSPSEAEPDAPAAHMAGRVTPAGDLDYSPTPPWATRALVERVLRHAGREGHCKFQSAWEPACGEGHMAEVLREYFRDVLATDIHDRNGYPDARNDFLANDGRGPGTYDWIITNPPFEDRVLRFMERALDLAGTGVAMFLQLRYLEGINRYERIYRDRPPTIVAPFVERVPLVMGRYDPEASTTTAFMWLVWLKNAEPQAPFWIPPGCRQALTRPDDIERFTKNPVQRRGSSAEAAE